MRIVGLILLGTALFSCQESESKVAPVVSLQTVAGEEILATEILERPSLLVYVDLSLAGSCLCNQELINRLVRLASLYPDVAVYSVIVPTQRNEKQFSNDNIPLEFLQELGPVYHDKTGYSRERYSFFNGSGFLFLDRHGDLVMALPMEVDEVPDIVIHKTLNLL